MAAGDAQRVWFPEMIEQLRDQWHPALSFEGIISLRDNLETLLQKIRAEGHIRSPVVRCPQCGHVGPGATPHVSVRAMILSLKRFSIAPAEPMHDLEKRWGAYRKQNDLDLYGKPGASRPAENPACIHPDSR
jgi:hypothetical protein